MSKNLANKISIVLKNLTDLEFNKDFRKFIDTDPDCKIKSLLDFDNSFVFVSDKLQEILNELEDRQRIAEQNANIQRVDAQVKGVKW
jgi:hypothetical protein